MRVFSVAYLLLILGLVHGGDYGKIDFCEIKYVEPGSDFRVECRSDEGITSKVRIDFDNTEPSLPYSFPL